MLTNVHDIRKALADLANVPAITSPDAIAKAKQFIDRYDKLRRPHVPKPTQNDYAVDVIGIAVQFRRAWKATADQDESLMQHVSIYLDSIFESSPWRMDQGSAIRADFVTGEWEPVPRNLLDTLGIQLMRSRRMLHQCENPDCRKYMVKEYSHDKYCSARCSDLMRATKVAAWRASRKTEKKRRKK